MERSNGRWGELHGLLVQQLGVVDGMRNACGDGATSFSSMVRPWRAPWGRTRKKGERWGGRLLLEGSCSAVLMPQQGGEQGKMPVASDPTAATAALAQSSGRRQQVGE